MIYDELLGIRSFFRGTGSVLVLASAALFSGIARGQVPAVTALPYLADSSLGTTVTIEPCCQVVPIPQAVQDSGFAGLLGGGFSTLLLEPEQAAAEIVATASVRQILIMKVRYTAQNYYKQWNADYAAEKTDLTETIGQTCPTGNSVVPKIRARLMANKINSRLMAMDCTLPEEESAEEAEEEVQALEESGEASQDILEGAEEAAEAADVAAAAAEEAIEITIDALEIVDACLEALSFF